MVRDGRLERWEKYGREVPAPLDAIVRRALAKQLPERFQTAAEFRDALDDLQFKFGMRVGPPDVGLLASDLLDTSPDAVERLMGRAQKWQIRSPAVSSAETPTATVPRARGSSGEYDSHPSSRGAIANPVATVVGAALDDAMAGLVSLVGLDQYETPAPTPVPAPAGAAWRGQGIAAGSLASFPGPNDDLAPGMMDLDAALAGAHEGESGVSGGAATPGMAEVAGMAPDNTGELALISPMRAIADLAIAAETGLIRFQRGSLVKDVYLVRGAPESINSNMSGDRFGEYLVTRGFLRSADLERTLAEMPRFGGKFGEALVGLGFMRPLDVFRLLSQHVRERVMELFTWTEGAFDYYRGLRNPMEAFPLGLNSFEILGAGVLALSYEFLTAHFEPLMDFHPRAVANPRISPEAFRLGPTPREVLGLIDGGSTLRAWVERITSSEEQLTFFRTLYLLEESSMAQFE
jgi:hypothetical protein